MKAIAMKRQSVCSISTVGRFYQSRTSTCRIWHVCTTPPIFKHGKSKTSSTFHHVVCLSNKATRLRIAGPDDVPGRFASLTTIHTRNGHPGPQSVTLWCYWIGSILLEASEVPVPMQLISRPDSQSDKKSIEVFIKFLLLVLIIIKAHHHSQTFPAKVCLTKLGGNWS
jgi:hypothetical protein